jgi:hypothetical protein
VWREEGDGGARRLIAVPLLGMIDKIVRFELEWYAASIERNEGSTWRVVGQEWGRGLGVTAAVRK